MHRFISRTVKPSRHFPEPEITVHALFCRLKKYNAHVFNANIGLTSMTVEGMRSMQAATKPRRKSSIQFRRPSAKDREMASFFRYVARQKPRAKAHWASSLCSAYAVDETHSKPAYPTLQLVTGDMYGKKHVTMKN